MEVQIRCNNNFGVSKSKPAYDWEQIEGIETSMKEGEESYYYKYKVNENNGTYSPVSYTHLDKKAGAFFYL